MGTLHDRLLKDSDCRFCQACVEVCPTGTIRDKLINTDETKEDAVVPCRHACPAHTDIPRYIRYVRSGNYDAAAAVIREKVPFPKALGYICSHVCELHCKERKSVILWLSAVSKDMLRNMTPDCTGKEKENSCRIQGKSLYCWRGTGRNDSCILSQKTGT